MVKLRFNYNRARLNTDRWDWMDGWMDGWMDEWMDVWSEFELPLIENVLGGVILGSVVIVIVIGGGSSRMAGGIDESGCPMRRLSSWRYSSWDHSIRIV